MRGPSLSDVGPAASLVVGGVNMGRDFPHEIVMVPGDTWTMKSLSWTDRTALIWLPRTISHPYPIIRLDQMPDPNGAELSFRIAK